jgi:hypothetical protein
MDTIRLESRQQQKPEMRNHLTTILALAVTLSKGYLPYNDIMNYLSAKFHTNLTNHFAFMGENVNMSLINKTIFCLS